MSIVRKCPFLKLFKNLLIMRRYLLVYLFISYAKQDKTMVTLTPLRVMHVCRVTFKEATTSWEFMRYCDIDAPIYDHDEFMDRIASINIRNIQDKLHSDQIIVTGIFINRDHILTSYIPFMTLFRNKAKDLYNMYFQFYPHKWIINGRNIGYYMNRGNLICGRRVYPFEDKIMENDEFRGPTPYDLMVFRTRDYLFYEDGYDYTVLKENISFGKIAPTVTELAGKKDDIGDTFKYVSIGMIDEDHIYNRNHLHTVEMEKGDRVIVNCAEWFPITQNPWICILNVENHVAIGSGAFLISKNKVFGVGSFTMSKGRESIHVFTDVRVLRDVINTTCTKFDGYGYGKYN